MTALAEPVRAQIRQARETAGLSLAALGRRLGVTGLSIANWESGRYGPRWHTVAEILAACTERAPDATCGTLQAYKRHRYRGEPADRACKDAYNASRRGHYPPRKYQPRPRQLKPCGTPAARRHAGITITSIDPHQAASVRLITRAYASDTELTEMWLMLGVHPDSPQAPDAS